MNLLDPDLRKLLLERMTFTYDMRWTLTQNRQLGRENACEALATLSIGRAEANRDLKELDDLR